MVAPPIHVAREKKAVAHGPRRNGTECGVLIVALPFDHGHSKCYGERKRITGNERQILILLYATLLGLLAKNMPAFISYYLANYSPQVNLINNTAA